MMMRDMQYEIRRIWERLGQLPARWARPAAIQMRQLIPVRVTGRTVIRNPGFGSSDYTGIYDGVEVEFIEGDIPTTKSGGLTFAFTDCTGIVESVFGNMALEVSAKIVWVRACKPSALVAGSSSSSCDAWDVSAVSSSTLLGAWSYVCHEAHTNGNGPYVVIS